MVDMVNEKFDKWCTYDKDNFDKLNVTHRHNMDNIYQ